MEKEIAAQDNGQNAATPRSTTATAATALAEVRAVQVMALFDGAIVALEHRRPGAPGAIRAKGAKGAKGEWRDFTIGPDAAADFALALDDTGAPSFALLRASSSGPEVGVPPSANAKAEVTAGGKRYEPGAWQALGNARREADGSARLRLPDDGEVVVDVGAVTFRVRYAMLSSQLPRTLRPDWRAYRYTGATFALTLLFLAAVFSVPPDLKSLSVDAFAAEQRRVLLTLKPPVEPVPDAVPKDQKPGDVGPRGAKASGATGRAGHPSSKPTHRRLSVKGPPDSVDVHLARPDLREDVKKMGVLGLMRSSADRAVTSIFSTHDSALGVEATNALGGLLGTEVGDNQGPGGGGLWGRGPGGGGRGGPETIGVGDLGRIGAGLRNGRGPGGYPPSAKLGSHVAHGPEVTQGVASVVGMDKELVRRVIRRHLNEVKFCYEKELGRHADLYGRVAVQFTIAATGLVVSSTVQSSTLGAPEAEQCIAAAVRRWEFPRPMGGLVMVTYPFVLQHAGPSTN